MEISKFLKKRYIFPFSRLIYGGNIPYIIRGVRCLNVFAGGNMVSKPRNILIISNNKEQRKTLKTLLENTDFKGIDFKTHIVTFKECMSHRLNEPILDLIVIGYDIVDHVLSYLLRAIKDKRIILVLSKKPTVQQERALREHNVVATFIEPVDADKFIWKIVEIVDKKLYLSIHPSASASRMDRNNSVD